MKQHEQCEFESEVLAAVLEARWPDHTDRELQAHASRCQICGDIASVAQAMGNLHRETRNMASLPDSGRVWWIAQMRKRREAMEAASRPITVAQVLGFACALGLLGTCFEAAFATLLTHWLLAASCLALLILAPVTVYLVGRE